MTLAVEDVVRAAREVWPDVSVDLEQLRAYLAERPGADAAHAGDLYLACACLADAPNAIAAFHAHFLADLHYLDSIARSAALTVDEIRQELAVKLLVAATDGNVRLAGYTGRGPLAGWIKVAATRLTIDLQRSRKREQPASNPDAIERWVEAASVDLDPELLVLRDQYRSAFRSSLQDALVELDAAHRAVLRLHYLEGVTTAALAALYKVSRNTIVRRIAEARTALFEATIELLTARVGLPPDQHRTLLQLVRSQLDVSIARLLAEPD